MAATAATNTISHAQSQFSQSVLAAHGWPITTSNVQFLNEWQTAEGQWGASGSWYAGSNWNPLNLESVPGSAGVTPTGSQAANSTNSILTFGSQQDGATATAAFLAQPHYTQIQSALSSDNALQAFQNGSLNGEISTWGTNPANFASATGNVPAGSSSTSSPSGTPTAGIMGSCNSDQAVIGEGGVLGVGSATLLNQCQAKAAVSALIIGGGTLIMLIGIALLFTGQKPSLPFGKSQQQGSSSSSEDDLANAHAEGFWKGQNAGPNRKGPIGKSYKASDLDDFADVAAA